jgi:hypothetical protein
MTWPGGSASSATRTFPSLSLGPNPSLNTELIQTQALASVWRSRLAHDGECGDLLQAGSPKAGTSNGPKPSASSFLPSAYALFQARASTSLSTATTAELLKGGGRGAVPTGQPTMFSDASSSFQKIVIGQYTQDMSQVPRTLLMLPPVAPTPPAPFFSTRLSSPMKFAPSSMISDPGDLARKAMIRHLVRVQEPETDDLNVKQPVPKQHKVTKARPHPLPIPADTTPSTRGPAPYPQHLTLVPSQLCPHCLAKDQLRLWTSPSPVPVYLSLFSELESLSLDLIRWLVT